jgi:ribosomal-protein-alanine N-acetyltransferase
VSALVAPTLLTERLVLEPLTLAHSAGMFAMWSHPEVCRHSGPAHDIGGRPIRLPAQSAADSDKIIAFFLHGAAAGVRFRWAMLTRDEGAFAGAVGFNRLGGCSELAYHLRPEFWGQGLMGEAARAALHWLGARPGCAEVEAFVEPANVASIRLTERLGLRPTGEATDGAARYLMALGD